MTSNLYIFLNQVVKEFQLSMNHLGAYEFESGTILSQAFLISGSNSILLRPFSLRNRRVKTKKTMHMFYFLNGLRCSIFFPDFFFEMLFSPYVSFDEVKFSCTL